MIHYPEKRTKPVAGTAGAMRVVVGAYFGRPRSGPPLTPPKKKRRPQAAVQPPEQPRGSETPVEPPKERTEAPTATTAPPAKATQAPESRWLMSPSGAVCHIEAGNGRTGCGRLVGGNWSEVDGRAVKCVRCEEVAP